MVRTESISIQVHPNDEQAQINFMQKFHWNLLNSQEIKTIDNHLERKGDTIYQVTNSERYIKLMFSRNIENPNILKIKQLEQEYNDLTTSVEKYPKQEANPLTILYFLSLCFFFIHKIGFIFVILSMVLILIYSLTNKGYKEKRLISNKNYEEKVKLYNENKKSIQNRIQEIFAQLEQY
jgi:mannose-6-phosphate isomerase class I